MKVEEFRMEESSDEVQTKNPGENRSASASGFLVEFASYTTLHGFHFVFESFSLFRRITWAILMLIGLATLIIQCLEGFNKLAGKDSVTVRELQHTEKAPFPAVTICNQNMLRKDKIMGTQAKKFMDDVESLMFGRGTQNISNETFNLDLDRVVKEAGHNISDMLSGCLWRGKFCGPENFTLFISSQRGLCYTFNSGELGHPSLNQSAAGRNHGLLLQLNAEPEQYYGPFNMLVGTGFRVHVHDQGEWPDMDNYGIDVSPGFSSTIQIQRQKLFRLKPPYKSQCGETKLRSFKTYSQSACVLECWTKALIDKCHCQILGMAQFDEYKRLRYCDPTEFMNCASPVSGEFLASLDCDCPLKCEATLYAVQLSSSSYPSRHVLEVILRATNETLVANATEEMINKLEAKLRRRLLQLNIFYQSLITEVTKEKPAYDIHDFGSDVGGNMGLFLGCSLLTLCEFVDFIILLCLRNGKHRKRVQTSR